MPFLNRLIPLEIGLAGAGNRGGGRSTSCGGLPRDPGRWTKFCSSSLLPKPSVPAGKLPKTSRPRKVNVENIELKAIYTPGHTDCSYSYLMNDRVFTGDTLLINGTGRTDFQNGSSYDAYDSLFNKLLKLPGKTLVFPAHDYNGKKNSTIENEKNNNPRLQVSSKEQYAEIMNNLKLANPKMMDVAVPANVKGLTLDQL